jgi:chaperonin GroES
MKLRPLLDKVVIKSVEAAETTIGGILLPGSAKEKPQISEVVAVGPGGIVNGEKVEMTVSVGDKVITTKYSGAEVKIDGVEYVIVSVGDILAVVEQ